MLEKGKQLHAKLTLKHLLTVNIISTFTAFEEFEGDASFRTFPHANSTGRGSRTSATTKMELFEQVALDLGILQKEDHCIGSRGKN